MSNSCLVNKTMKFLLLRVIWKMKQSVVISGFLNYREHVLVIIQLPLVMYVPNIQKNVYTCNMQYSAHSCALLVHNYYVLSLLSSSSLSPSSSLSYIFSELHVISLFLLYPINGLLFIPVPQRVEMDVFVCFVTPTRNLIKQLVIEYCTHYFLNNFFFQQSVMLLLQLLQMVCQTVCTQHALQSQSMLQVTEFSVRFAPIVSFISSFTCSLQRSHWMFLPEPPLVLTK